MRKNRMRTIMLAIAASLVVPFAVASTTSAQELTTDSAAADPIISCGTRQPDKDGSSWGRYFVGNGINIRKSPSTSSGICAQGQKSHVVDYHCWTLGSDGYTWTYLRDATTHYAGWVRDTLLTNHGSLVHC